MNYSGTVLVNIPVGILQGNGSVALPDPNDLRVQWNGIVPQSLLGRTLGQLNGASFTSGILSLRGTQSSPSEISFTVCGRVYTMVPPSSVVSINLMVNNSCMERSIAYSVDSPVIVDQFTMTYNVETRGDPTIEYRYPNSVLGGTGSINISSLYRTTTVNGQSVTLSSSNTGIGIEGRLRLTGTQTTCAVSSLTIESCGDRRVFHPTCINGRSIWRLDEVINLSCRPTTISYSIVGEPIWIESMTVTVRPTGSARNSTLLPLTRNLNGKSDTIYWILLVIAVILAIVAVVIGIAVANSKKSVKKRVVLT